MTYSIKIQKKKIATRQRQWGTMALKDSAYSDKRAKQERKKGNYLMAKDYENEANIGRYWAKRRFAKADKFSDTKSLNS